MTMRLRTRIVLVVVAVAALAVASLAAYAGRERLEALPLVRRAAVALGISSSTPHDAEHAVTPASSPSDSNAGGPVSIDPQRQQLIGVRLATVTLGEIAPTIRASGIVRYDETRQADVNVKVDGWIRDLYVDYTGQPVRKGQPLFSLYSPDLLSTENEYLLALKNRDQMKASQVLDAREYAERLVEAARQRLALWDLPAEQIAALETTRRPQEAVTFTSPVEGYVIEKQALQGMHVTAGQTLYKVADLSTVWVEAAVYEHELSLIRVGQAASVTLDAYPGQRFDGRAVYVYPYVEEATRTVKVRFAFANAAGRLKPGMYANVELRAPASRGLTIPSDAVLDSGTRQTVFVAQGEGNFVPRAVTVGRHVGDTVEITRGLEEGEQVASAAAFFLDSESQLRAGLQSYEPPPAAAAAATGTASAIDIAFRAQPDPPRTGETTFEVTLKTSSGQPITDADVVVQLLIPAMPTMNMPAVRSGATLISAGNGVYRGTGELTTPGRWDVTVIVTRAGQQVGRRQLALVAR
jgi:Cu(I)/Ag(I) efflux system membrane fusion protein/cobalt-zinc-cadmium efflux system membrane fusion protein